MGCASLFEINKFFFCASLRLGSLIIGYLGLLAHVLQTAGGAARLEYYNTFTLTYYFLNENGTDYEPGVPNVSMFVSEYMAMGVAYNVISAIFHLSLVYGIHKAKSEFILPWLIVKGFECVVIVIAITVGTILYAAQPEMRVGILFLLISIFIICIWLALYTYSCVYSYYRNIKSIPGEKELEKEFPPAYITTIISDEKKQNVTDIGFNQNVI